jgi:hypothetical protein
VHELRTLTEGETRLLLPVFGDAVAYEAVRLSGGFGLSPIAAIALRRRRADGVTVRSTIYFARDLPRDFAAEGDEDQALLVHEIAHVWQWQRLGVRRFLARYVREYLGCGRDAAAMYLYSPRQKFEEARLEAQAQMLQDYYRGRARGEELGDLEASLAGSGFYGL